MMHLMSDPMSEMVKWRCPTCLFCGEGTILSLEFSKLQRWQVEGEFVQNVFPEMSPEDRELLISGTHPACWDKYMGE